MSEKPSHKSPINYLLDAVSVCLLLISLAALFFAVGKSGRAKTEPELSKASAGDCKRYVTRNIEDIRIGERTLGTNPQGRLESELDESVFQTVPHCGYSLRYTAENGSRCAIRLLRPADWLDWELTRLCRASDGKAVDAIDLVSEDLASGGFDILPDYELETWLELPEMGVVGWARVTDVDADVEIEQGAGNIVTGVFAHMASSTLDLTVEGQTVPIGCTANHPFWSVDRQDFVDAGLLKEGERVQLYSGETKRVVQRLPRPGPQNVYNLEVYSEHVYCVEDLGILVHNKCNERYYKPNGKIRRFDGHKPAYEVNEAHVFGPKYVIGKTPLPADAQEVFSKAIPSDPDNPSVWFAKNEAGKIYRYSLNHDKTVAHFSGIYLEGPGTRNITDYARLRLGILKRKGLKCR